MKNRYNEEFKEKLVNECIATGKKKYVANKYNVPLTTLSHWILNRNAINVGNAKYSDEIRNKIINDYKNGKTLSQLVIENNIIEGTINNWIKDIARTRGPISKCKNYTYFDKIDTEMKAYWLGFIMADGNVSIYNNQYSLKIKIQKRDIEILNRLQKDLNSDYKIAITRQSCKLSNNPTIREYCSISITSKHLVKSLIKLGVVPSKTGKEIIPNIRPDMLKHFIRGFYDGDGISCCTENTKVIGFVGNTDMIEALRKILMWNVKLMPHWKTPFISSILTSSIKNITNFHNLVYKDNEFCLKRKHDNILKIIKSKRIPR